jgi:hypothetical protein
MAMPIQLSTMQLPPLALNVPIHQHQHQTNTRHININMNMNSISHGHIALPPLNLGAGVPLGLGDVSGANPGDLSDLHDPHTHGHSHAHDFQLDDDPLFNPAATSVNIR